MRKTNYEWIIEAKEAIARAVESETFWPSSPEEIAEYVNYALPHLNTIQQRVAIMTVVMMGSWQECWGGGVVFNLPPTKWCCEEYSSVKRHYNKIMKRGGLKGRQLQFYPAL